MTGGVKQGKGGTWHTNMKYYMLSKLMKHDFKMLIWLDTIKPYQNSGAAGANSR
jgi:hypothetical protein